MSLAEIEFFYTYFSHLNFENQQEQNHNFLFSLHQMLSYFIGEQRKTNVFNTCGIGYILHMSKKTVSRAQGKPPS